MEVIETPAANSASEPNRMTPQEAPADLRFVDPLVQDIVNNWRMLQNMVRAEQRLTLQIKAILRSFTEGDKTEANKLYRSMQNGMGHELAEAALLATAPLLAARRHPAEARADLEKALRKLAKQLPIAHMADEIKGVNHDTLAKIVGECGDLSCYKTVDAVWKRCGLAVIEGERQRRCSDQEKAILHGYSPSRRAVLWNVGDALFKSQGKDETAGPYRKVYDRHKAQKLEESWTAGHAHNHAMRVMTKKLMKRLTIEWRRVARNSNAKRSH